MSRKFPKTNVMRVLQQNQISYTPYYWDIVSEVRRETTAKIFKTLVTVGKSGEHYVFVVPVERELDLKKAAQAVDEKNIHLVKQEELLPLTGYVHGGCSPIGMKKLFRTTFDCLAKAEECIIFSAGKVGYSVAVNMKDIERLLPLQYADIKTQA